MRPQSLGSSTFSGIIIGSLSLKGSAIDSIALSLAVGRLSTCGIAQSLGSRPSSRSLFAIIRRFSTVGRTQTGFIRISSQGSTDGLLSGVFHFISTPRTHWVWFTTNFQFEPTVPPVDLWLFSCSGALPAEIWWLFCAFLRNRLKGWSPDFHASYVLQDSSSRVSIFPFHSNFWVEPKKVLQISSGLTVLLCSPNAATIFLLPRPVYFSKLDPQTRPVSPSPLFVCLHKSWLESSIFHWAGWFIELDLWAHFLIFIRLTPKSKFPWFWSADFEWAILLW